MTENLNVLYLILSYFSFLPSFFFRGDNHYSGDITTHCDLSSVPCPGHLATQVLAQPEEPSQLFGAAVTSLQTGTGKPFRFPLGFV